MKIVVGVFIIASIIAMFSFLYLLAEHKGTFNDRYTYKFKTITAENFSVGMPLKFSGFRVGVIELIKLRDDGSVEMEFSVPQENKKWITKGSVLMLKKPLIGSSHIDLYSAFGSEELKEGSELMIVMNDDINDIVEKLHPLIDRVVSIVNSVDKITKRLADDDSLLTSLTGSKQTTKDLQHALKSLAQMMQDVRYITQNLDKDIVSPASSAIEELDTILKDVNQKLKALDSTVKTVGGFDDDLENIKTQVDLGLQKSNQLLDKVDSLLVDEEDSKVELP
jgi:ABC-type transporter Mla subunit MlaD